MYEYDKYCNEYGTVTIKNGQKLERLRKHISRNAINISLTSETLQY